MKKKITLRAIIAAAVILLIAMGIWKSVSMATSAEALSEDEVRQIAKERFNGNVVNIKEHDSLYEMMVKLESGLYQVKIDRSSGEVLGVNQKEKSKPVKEQSKEEIAKTAEEEHKGKLTSLEKRTTDKEIVYDAVVEDKSTETKMTINGNTGEIVEEKTEKKVSPEPPAEAMKTISESEAVNIALSTVSGEVDDVDFETISGQPYYFVEIENAEDQEANIQIHAITGEVKSIQWDD